MLKFPNPVDSTKLRDAYMKSSAGKAEPVLINMSMNTARDNDSLYPGIEEKTGKKLSFQQSIPS